MLAWFVMTIVAFDKDDTLAPAVLSKVAPFTISGIRALYWIAYGLSLPTPQPGHMRAGVGGG